MVVVVGGTNHSAAQLLVSLHILGCTSYLAHIVYTGSARLCVTHSDCVCGIMACGYQVNNQWRLSAEIQANSSQTSFYCALRASVGVLMVLDPQGKVTT